MRLKTIEVPEDWVEDRLDTSEMRIIDEFFTAHYIILNPRGWFHYRYKPQIGASGVVCVECSVPLKHGLCAWEWLGPDTDGTTHSTWMCDECAYNLVVSEGHDVPPVPALLVVDC